MEWLLSIVFVLIVVGVLLWVLSNIPAIDPAIKQIIRVLVIAVAALWVLHRVFSHFGWM